MNRNQNFAAQSIKERSITAITLLLLVGLVSTAGAIMSYYFLKNPDILFAEKTPATAVKKQLALQFEDGRFTIPGYLLRNVKRTPLRKVTKVNLVVPLNWSAGMKPQFFTSKSDLSEWMLVEIEKRRSFLPISDRLQKIYRFYVASPAVIHSSGLYRYRFKSGSPYDSIELFTDDLQNPGFIIRCEMQSSLHGTRLCYRQIPISSRLSILYKFPRSQINQWQQVHKTVQSLIANIYRRSGV